MSVRIKTILVAVLVIVVCVAVLSFFNASGIKEAEVFNIPKIKVHVKGAVVNPGLYELDAASRVNDAITLAGGALDSANINAVNLARFLEDGEELIIPEVDTGDKPVSNNESMKININTADINKLCELDGIGETVARQIVQYRNERGQFSVKEEIMNVPGIGEALFEKIKDRIYVN